MQKQLIALSLILVVFVCAAWSQQQPRAAWEYKFEYSMNEKKANSLGQQGWELSAIESTSSAGVDNNVPVYVFKRQK